jgi:hypothetical protein
MNFSSKQLANGRWGIYEESTLLATIGSYPTCEKISSLLQVRTANKFFPSLPTQSNDYCLRQLILEISDPLNTRLVLEISETVKTQLEKFSHAPSLSKTEQARTILSHS